jgi:hypothetical protein
MGFDFTIKKGTTSKIIEFMLRDSTTGLGKTGLLTGDMTGSYVREGGTKVALSFTSASAGDPFSTGRWAEVDATNMRGLYQFHLPNASLASGAEAVTFHFNATGVIDKIIRISLLDVDLRDATDAGLSNLDAAVSSRSTVAATDIVSGGAITTSGGSVSNVTLVATTTTNSDMRGTDNALLASSAPTNFGSLSINGSGHISRVTLVDTTTTNTDMVDVSGLASSADLATVDTVVDAIKVVTDRLDTALVLDGAVYQFTTNALENAPSGGGGGGDSKEDIYTYFTSSSRQDTFKANVSGLSTFDASTDQVTASNMRGTDDALLAANTPANFASLGIDSSGHINRVVLVDTTTTNSDMVDVSSLATSAEIAALNDPTAASIADAVWDESLSQHNTGGSTGKALKQLKEGTITIESAVNDASATSTTFVTDLVEATDGFYHDKVLVFINGDLAGQARHVETYTGSTKQIVVSQAFTSAPSDGDEFLILAGHEHSLGEIADATWDESRSGHTNVGTFGYYLDARVSQAGGGGGVSASDIWNALLTDYTVAGSFGARFQESDRYTNTTAQIKYVNQGDAYDDVANPSIQWAVTKDYAGAASIQLYVEHRVTGTNLLTHAITYVDETTLKATLSSSDTAFSDLTTDADFGVHPYWIVANYNGELQTVVKGAMSIQKSN